MTKVLDYVLERYPAKFKNKNVIVTELNDVYEIKVKDESPLFINKSAIN